MKINEAPWFRSQNEDLISTIIKQINEFLPFEIENIESQKTLDKILSFIESQNMKLNVVRSSDCYETSLNFNGVDFYAIGENYNQTIILCLFDALSFLKIT